jgi:hypothetical protein
MAPAAFGWTAYAIAFLNALSGGYSSGFSQLASGSSD